MVAAVGLITGNRQDAADAVQDAIVGYLSKPPQREVRNIAAWITGVASNRMRDLLRSCLVINGLELDTAYTAIVSGVDIYDRVSSPHMLRFHSAGAPVHPGAQIVTIGENLVFVSALHPADQVVDVRTVVAEPDALPSCSRCSSHPRSCRLPTACCRVSTSRESRPMRAASTPSGLPCRAQRATRAEHTAGMPTTPPRCRRKCAAASGVSGSAARRRATVTCATWARAEISSSA